MGKLEIVHHHLVPERTAADAEDLHGTWWPFPLWILDSLCKLFSYIYSLFFASFLHRNPTSKFPEASVWPLQVRRAGWFWTCGLEMLTPSHLSDLKPSSLSLQPFEYPVCTEDGVVFDLLWVQSIDLLFKDWHKQTFWFHPSLSFRSIVPWIKKYGTNPISGEVSAFSFWTDSVRVKKMFLLHLL